MDTIELKIKDMNCGSCVSSIIHTLQRVSGVDAVDVDLACGIARVSGDAQAVPAMPATLAAAGYEVESLSTGVGAKMKHTRYDDIPTGIAHKSGGYCH